MRKQDEFEYEEIPLEEGVSIMNDHLERILPSIESWYTINNNDFYFNFKTVATVDSGLYSMIYNEGNGFGISKLNYKSDFYQYLLCTPNERRSQTRHFDASPLF